MSKLGLAGFFRLIKTKADGQKEVIEFPNMILDTGLDMCADGVTGIPLAYCRIGTGTTAVSAGQSTLVTQSASTNTNTPSAPTNFVAMTASSPRYNKYTSYKRFAAGTLNGTYTEIGFGPASSGNLFNRALISPSISIGLTETLDVEYELRTYIPSADVTGSVVIQGVTYSYTLRPLDINQTSAASGQRPWGHRNTQALAQTGTAKAFIGGALVAQTSVEPTYTAFAYESSGVIRSFPDSYVPGTGYRKVRFLWDLAQLNVAGGSFTHLKFGVDTSTWQAEFSPAVPKTASKQLTLDVGFTFARYP